MKKLLLILLAFFSLSFAFSQGKYCMSHSDFLNNNWIQEDLLTVEPIEDGEGYISFSEDKELNKILKKKCRYIIYNDVLYVNCRKLDSKGYPLGYQYSLGFRFMDDKVCIISHKVNFGSTVKMAGLSSMAQQVSGIAGAIVSSALYTSMLENKVCYIISSDSKKVERIDDKNMAELIKKHKPELLEKYNSIDKKKDRESAINIIEYFKDMKFIFNY